MKFLLVGALMTMVIASVETAAHAQAITQKSVPPMKSQSAPLVTQPASINRVPASSGQRAPYTADQLNGLLGTLEANPKPTTPPPQKSSIESLIQRFSTSDRKPTAIDPIDFFKPPALDGGVKIPLQ